MDDAIPLSVILVWSDPREGIAEALRSLVEQVDAVGGEILVVSAWDASETFPGVRWLLVEEHATEPRAWEIGRRNARGGTLAFGQARCRYDAGWVAAILRERSKGASLVAGPVVLEGEGWSARAAYLCDYALIGPGGGAAACNLAADRAILPEPEQEPDGLPKTALLELGVRVAWATEMVATTRVIGSPWSGWLGRFHRGRQYAARRASGWPNALRLPAGLGCVALPALLYARMVGRVRRESWPTLTLGGPLVAAMLGAWALGEWAGYWFGAGPGVRRR